MVDNNRRGFLGLCFGVIAAGVAGSAFASSASAQSLVPTPASAPGETARTETESSMEPTQGRRRFGGRRFGGGGGRGFRRSRVVSFGPPRRRRRGRGLLRILRRL